MYSEIDSYIHQQRLEKRKNSGNTSNSRAKRVKGGYDTVFLVDEALQQITGRSECTSREVCKTVDLMMDRFYTVCGSTFTTTN